MRNRPDLYAEITASICAALEAGVVPWQRPWRGATDHRNGHSGRAYCGCNVLLLNIVAATRAYTDLRWLTYRQAQLAGGNVRRGERGTTVVFWSVTRKARADGVERTRPILRSYTVFNVAQCDGLALAPPVPSLVPDENEVSERVTRIVGALSADGCPALHGGDVAAYHAVRDLIVMPPARVFASESGYSSTLLHEAIHATGHPKRLARYFDGRFGSAAYAFEELVAEMGSAYLCAAVGVGGQGLQHPAYIASWLRVLRGDHYAIFTAAREAEKAADWLLVRAGLGDDEGVLNEEDANAEAMAV